MNRLSPPTANIFVSANGIYHADTCQPLEKAAVRGELRLDAFGHGSYPGKKLSARQTKEILSVGAWDARKMQSWGLDWHRNEGIEFTCLMAGQLPFFVEESKTILQPGDITITRPWQRHRLGDPHIPPSHLAWFILDVGVRHPHQPWQWPSWMIIPEEILKKLTVYMRQNEKMVWPSNPIIKRCFQEISRTTRQTPSPSSLASLKLQINQALMSLADLFSKSPVRLQTGLTSAERTIQLFLEQLEQRSSEPWTLEKMAAECQIGRSQFASHCRKITNHSPIHHLNHCRIRQACRLLKEDPHRKIIDLAFDAGFQSSQYFATVFARHTGCTPSQWIARKNKTGRRS